MLTENAEMVEIYQFRPDLPEIDKMGDPETLYVRSTKTKETGRGRTLWNFTPIQYDPDTQALIHLRNVVSHWWPENVIARMDSRSVPVKIHEYP